MRPNMMTRSIVSGAVVAGLAVGTLAGAATSFAASAPQAQPAVSILATENLGLTTKQAQGIQRWLTGWGYEGEIDGLLGTKSWMAMQNYLKKDWGYRDAIDGIVGPNTIRALQRFLAEHSGYKGPIDGIAGPGTRAAWANWANYISVN